MRSWAFIQNHHLYSWGWKWPTLILSDHFICFANSACSWYQILTKSEKKVGRPLAEWHKQPLHFRDTQAPLTWCRVAGSWKHHDLQGFPIPMGKFFTLVLVRDQCPIPLLLPKAALQAVALHLFSVDRSQAVLLFGCDSEWILSVPLR